MSDQDTIKDYLEGKKRGFNLIEDWIRSAVNHRIWVDRVSEDDVVADAHEKLLTNLRESTFRLESSLKTYVQRIALYTCVDAVRRERTTIFRPIDQGVSSMDVMGPHEALEKNEEEQLFKRITALLPDKCRELWEMVFVEKLKGREIAARLGTTEGAIRTSLSRCKEKAMEIRSRLT